MPRTLFLIASLGFASISGTCLCAAAWKMTCGMCSWRSMRIRASSQTSATRAATSTSGWRAAQLAVHLEERELGPLDEQELLRTETGDLPGELRADRAAGAGDHDALARQERPDLRLVEIDRLASQQVLDLDVAYARHVHLALEHVVEARDDPDAHLDLPADADQAQDLLPGDLGDRDHDLLDAEVPDEARKVLGRAEHADAVDHGAPLLQVVVDEALHVQVDVAAARDLARREDTRASGAHEQRRDLLLAFHAGGRPLPALGDLVEVAAQHAAGRGPLRRRGPSP